MNWQNMHKICLIVIFNMFNFGIILCSGKQGLIKPFTLFSISEPWNLSNTIFETIIKQQNKVQYDLNHYIWFELYLQYKNVSNTESYPSHLTQKNKSVILPNESFSPESGGRVKPKTAIEAISKQGTIRLKK